MSQNRFYGREKLKSLDRWVIKDWHRRLHSKAGYSLSAAVSNVHCPNDLVT